MQKSGKIVNPFDLNRDGVVTIPEIEEAVKRSFTNVKHDITELKNVQEHGLAELNRIRKDLDEFVHRDDFAASAQQIQGFVRLLEKNLHEKESKLLKHMAVLENRMSRLTSCVMEGTELKTRVASVEKQTKDFEGMIDLSHLNRKLHDEILRLSSDLLTLKHSVRGDLQEKVTALETQLAALSGTDTNHLFITRAELDNVANELREQQSEHISIIDQQLNTFQEHFSVLEELLEKREKVEADLGTLREHLLTAGEFLKREKDALPAKEEFRKLNERVGRMERQLKLEIRKEIAKELAKHDEKMTDLRAFLKTRMADLVKTTITRDDLERALSTFTTEYKDMGESLAHLREALSGLENKGAVIDDLRLQIAAVGKELESLQRTKADLTDLTSHNVSKQQFLREITRLENSLDALKREFGKKRARKK